MIKTKHANAFISYDRDGLEFSENKILSFAVVILDAINYRKNIIEKPSIETANSYKDQKGKIRVSMNIFKLDGKMMYSY